MNFLRSIFQQRKLITPTPALQREESNCKFIFRGSMDDVIDNRNNLKNVSRVEVEENPFSFCDNRKLKKLFEALDENSQITELSLMTRVRPCDQDLGILIGKNTTLRILEVAASGSKFSLFENVFEGVKMNTHLTEFHAIGFYHSEIRKHEEGSEWSEQEIDAIADVIRVNKTLKVLDVSANIIPIYGDWHRIYFEKISDPYEKISDRGLATLLIRTRTDNNSLYRVDKARCVPGYSDGGIVHSQGLVEQFFKNGKAWNATPRL